MLKGKKYLFFIVPLFWVFAFCYQYFNIISYIEHNFKYTKIEIKQEIFNSEYINFKFYLIENIMFSLFQSIGMFFCLNIGFLYFNLKFKVLDIVKLVVLSSFSVIIFQLILNLYVKNNNLIYSTSTLNDIAAKFSLLFFFKEESVASWLKLSLSSVNIIQFLVLILLTIGINNILKLKIYRAFSITIRTYGIGIILWCVFAMVMEMNFN